MALSNELIQAVNRYGPSVAGVAKRYGISGEALLAKLIQGESGGRRDQTSSAGAKGYTQFMPGTRQEVLSRYGIDPWGGPDEAVHAAALHLRGKLGHATGLSGYNPGSPSYTNYILGQKVGDVHRGGGGSSGGTSSGGSTPVTLTAQVPTTENTFDPGQASDLSALAGLLQQAPVPSPVQAPQAPNSSQRYLSSAGTSPVVTPPAPQQDNLGALLAAIQSPGEGLPEVSRGSESVSVSGSVPNAQAASTEAQTASGRYPLARHGQVIGTPHAGTHTLGDWQSDNAVDIKVPEGTPMVALQSGTVVKVRHHPQDGGRFAGDQITVRGANGNEYFYAHGRANVKAGQRIRKGQSLGVTGSASGVAHLHFGQKRGSPFQHVGR